MLHKRHNSLVTLFILLALVGVSKPAKAFLLAQSENVPTTFSLPEKLPQDAKVQIAASNSTSSINQSLTESFKNKYPKAQVNIETQDSSNALKSLSEGKADLVSIGRSLTSAEKAQGFIEIPISREKIAIVVSPNNSYDGNLTFSQFAQIFRGEITDWADLGGPPGEIKLVDLPDSNDTRQAFPNYEVFESGEFTTGSNAVKLEEDSTDAMITALGANGIGYAVANDVIGRDDVKIVSMHQTQPDDPRYPFSQPFNLVYQGTPSETAKAYLGFATAEGGKQVIASRVGSLSTATAIASGLAQGSKDKNPNTATSPQADGDTPDSDVTAGADTDGDTPDSDATAGADTDVETPNSNITGDTDVDTPEKDVTAGLDTPDSNITGDTDVDTPEKDVDVTADVDVDTPEKDVTAGLDTPDSNITADVDVDTPERDVDVTAGADADTPEKDVTAGLDTPEKDVTRDADVDVDPPEKDVDVTAGADVDTPDKDVTAGLDTDADTPEKDVIADADTDSSGEINPDVDGSGEINPSLEDSGSLNPDVDTSGEINPDVEDSGSLNPDVDTSGEINPGLEDSGDALSSDNLEIDGEANSEAAIADGEGNPNNTVEEETTGEQAIAKKGKWWWWLPLLLGIPLLILGAMFALGGKKKSDQEPAITNIPRPDAPNGGTGLARGVDDGNISAMGTNKSGNANNVTGNAAGTTSRLGNAAIATGGAALAGGAATATNFVGGKKSVDNDNDLDIELDEPGSVTEIPSNPVNEFTDQQTKIQTDVDDDLNEVTSRFANDTSVDTTALGATAMGGVAATSGFVEDSEISGESTTDIELDNLDTNVSELDTNQRTDLADQDATEFRGDFVLQEETRSSLSSEDITTVDVTELDSDRNTLDAEFTSEQDTTIDVPELDSDRNLDLSETITSRTESISGTVNDTVSDINTPEVDLPEVNQTNTELSGDSRTGIINRVTQSGGAAMAGGAAALGGAAAAASGFLNRNQDTSQPVDAELDTEFTSEQDTTIDVPELDSDRNLDLSETTTNRTESISGTVDDTVIDVNTPEVDLPEVNQTNTELSGDSGTGFINRVTQSGGAAMAGGAAAASGFLNRNQDTSQPVDAELDTEFTLEQDTAIDVPELDIDRNALDNEFTLEQDTILNLSDLDAEFTSEQDTAIDFIDLDGEFTSEQDTTIDVPELDSDRNLDLSETTTNTTESISGTVDDTVIDINTPEVDLPEVNQTNTELSGDSGTGIINRVTQSGGAAMAGGAAAASGFLNRNQDTSQPVDAELDTEFTLEQDTAIDVPELDIDRNALDNEFTLEQDTILNLSDLDAEFTSEQDTAIDFIDLDGEFTSEQDTTIDVPELDSDRNLNLSETTTNRTESISGTVDDTVIDINTPEVDLPEVNQTNTELSGDSGTGFINRVTQSGGAAMAGGAAALGGAAAAASGFLNRNQDTSQPVDADLDAEFTSEQDTAIDFIDSNGEFTSEQDTTIDVPELDSDRNLDLSETTTNRTESISGTVDDTVIDINTPEVDLPEVNQTNTELSGDSGTGFINRVTQSGGAAMAGGAAAASGFLNRNQDISQPVDAEFTSEDEFDISLETTSTDVDSSLGDITLDNTANMPEISLEEITLDNADTSINASLEEITFNDATDNSELSLEEIAFDDTSSKASSEEITFDNDSQTSEISLEEIGFDNIESKDISSQNINLDDLGFEESESSNNTTSDLLSNKTAEITSLSDDQSNDLNNISEWLDSLETPTQSSDNISEWLDTLNTDNIDSTQEERDQETTMGFSQEADDISFKFLEDLLDRDSNPNQNNQ